MSIRLFARVLRIGHGFWSCAVNKLKANHAQGIGLIGIGWRQPILSSQNIVFLSKTIFVFESCRFLSAILKLRDEFAEDSRWNIGKPDCQQASMAGRATWTVVDETPLLFKHCFHPGCCFKRRVYVPRTARCTFS